MSVLYVRDKEGKFVPVYTIKGEKGDPGKDGVDATPYTLPTASETVKGGVMIGEGLRMDGEKVRVREDVYELIETITLAEETKTIVRTIEPDGMPYNFDAVTIKIASAPTASTGSGAQYVFIRAKIGEELLTATVQNLVRNARCDCLSVFDNDKGYWRAYGFMPNIAYSNVNTAFYSPPVDCLRYRDAVKANGIEINTGVYLALSAGTTIEIWGVRANA